MSADNIRLTYSSNAGVAYSIYFDRFLDEEIPRTTLGQAEVNYAVLGAKYATGPAVTQPNIWTINSALRNQVTNRAYKDLAQYNEVQLIKELYAAWDTDRANGLAAKCTIEDQILGFGITYSAETWFTEPPTYTLIGGYGSGLIQVVFGLTEV